MAGFASPTGLVGAGATSEELAAFAESTQGVDTVIHGNALKAAVLWAACRGLNQCAEMVYALSQVEVPEADFHDYERYPMTLAESGRYPGNDPDMRATPHKPYAEVEYDAPYAMAQHEGYMIYERDGQQVEWVVENYTKEGSKAQYLADPLKAVMPEMEAIVGAEVAAAIASFTA